MREFAISVEIKAPVKTIWQTLLDVDRYRDWNPMFTVPQHQLEAGGFLQLAPVNSDRQPNTNNKPGTIIEAKINAINEQQQLVLSRDLIHSSLVHMVHYFELKPSTTGPVIFSQRWQASGMLIPLMWRKLSLGMAKFNRLNQALKNHCEQFDISQPNSSLGD